MALVPLKLGTIAGLDDAAEHALADIAASLAEEAPLDGKRKLTLTVTFEPKGNHIITTTEVRTALPARASTGVAWVENGVLMHEERCLPDEGRQTTHPVLAAVPERK